MWRFKIKIEKLETGIQDEYDRVTEILSPFTGIEFVDKNILEYAAERGTRVHKYIEGYLNGWKLAEYEEDAAPYVASFGRFWGSSGHAFEGGKMVTEKRMFCNDKQITGQVDVIIECDECTYVIDWKTSSMKHKFWELQGAAYRYLCEREGYSNIEAVLFVKLSKSGNRPVLYKDENYEENLELFFKCLEIYRYFDMKKTRNKGWAR